jgi:membrane-associated phospholipid phosphatase
MRALMRQAYSQVRRPKWFIYACVVGLIVAPLCPTDLRSYHTPAAGSDLAVALVTDHYLHFANTVAQVALPILLKDRIGLMQDAYVGVSNALATHGLKLLVNRWKIRGTRLGERPIGADSQFNMPSGHSSMASCAAYFVCRRYGWMHALYLIPILLLTMYARVALDEHTVTAVIAGGLLGLLMAAIFTSARMASPRARRVCPGHRSAESDSS